MLIQQKAMVWGFLYLLHKLLGTLSNHIDTNCRYVQNLLRLTPITLYTYKG